MSDTEPKKSPPLEISCSRQMIPWLYEQHISLAFTTYQTNRLFFIGLKPNGVLSIFERLFDRPMGLYTTRDRLYMGCRFQLWQLDNALPDGETHKDYDAVYIPRLAYTTGELDIHDLAVTNTQKIVFVNTAYSCLATVSDRYSFAPIWQPEFIGKLAPEDRCHLNGLAMVKGKPVYVSAISRSDVAAGWRNQRENGGCIINIQNNRMVIDSLSMPHSPRWYRDRLWVLNSGTGEFGYIDRKAGEFNAIAFCPGYLRGLAFWEKWAIVGLSKPRGDRMFTGLALDDRLAAKNAAPGCGLMVINLDTGNIDHWMQIEGIVTELYDIQIIPGVRRPMALGFMTEEICQWITIAPTTKTREKTQKTQPAIEKAPSQGKVFPFTT